ncbi:MAG: TRAP transporter substrate-binding protein [Fidelibacterota bacterium]|nr:MAG: TRAP transporter substrate-binding protein [Candidatus Neomarinimicrobiota bacterium]
MSRKSRVLVVGFVLAACCFYGCSGSRDVAVLKLAHVLDTTHPVHKGMVYLADKVAEYSNGQLTVDIYPGGQLGSEREYIESLQIGSLDMTKVSSAVLENFVPSMAVFSLPYVFRSDSHRWKILFGDIGQKMLLDGEPVWLRGLCFYETGSRNFYLRDKPVYTPEDLKGLKIRVMRSYWSIQTINALGGSATPIAFGELYTALQQGVVDAAENNIPTLFQSRHYETCKYVSLDGHSSPSDVLLISTHTWERLTPQQQVWLQDAVAASVEYQRGLWDEATQSALKAMEAHGVTVIRPDIALFQQQVEPLYAKLKADKDPLYQLVEEIRSVPSD